MKNSNRTSVFFIALSVLTALAIRMALFAFYGSLLGGDSQSYIDMAKTVMREGITYYPNHIDAPYYWGYPTFLALIFSMFGENITVVCIIQIILAGLSMALIYLSIFRMTGRPWIGVLLIAFYNINLEVIEWDCFILSDSLGMTMEALCVFSFVRLIDGYEKGRNAGTMDSNKPYDWMLFAVTSLLYFLARSNAIVIIFFMCVVLLFRLEKKKQIMLGGLFLACFAALVSIIMWSAVMHPENINLMATFEGMMRDIREGSVISGRPEYDVPVASNGILGYAFFIVKRIAYYWAVFLKAYSMGHKLLSIAAISPVYLLAIYSGIQAVKNRQRKYIELIFIILLSAFVQTLEQIDFDFRYRAPLFMLLILLGSYGLAEITDKMQPVLKRKKVQHIQEAGGY